MAAPSHVQSSSTETSYSADPKPLPTGAVFLFEFLNPLLTNTGSCTAFNKSLDAVLIAVCGFFCMVMYRLRLRDFVHAFVAVVGFLPLVLPNSDTARCFYPEFEAEKKRLLKVLPPLIGLFSGLVFVLFPYERHGIGYTTTTTTTSEKTTTSRQS
ncbi:hypothetical protein TIFTF001_015708 [Ficus carica]|uniref:Uncharacterized protein n=1 Tax=Ficus carica TaxID=3494 RepID=A0AA88ALZ0_FICCA|nr:hypothetical protein TIFTF001_015708 [Ficus carica]